MHTEDSPELLFSAIIKIVLEKEASVDEYFYPAKNVEKNTARRQIDSSLDLLSDNELKIIQGTIDGILNSRENKK